MTEEKVIAIESRGGPLHVMLRNVMRMVPKKDQHDVALQRMLAFRLGIDGESATREYLMRRIRDMIQCRYNGSLYDFLCNTQDSTGTIPANRGTDPPESA
ncbi:hypothetical protein [Desulfatitalea alkaliphila]|uniref:Uncharacterized protein n=1 Tax=Desulfatitalea alkaliphila TaxID=2929485 RepID=A0AA41R3D9_9BACT|nr:hypothetical protein [Desulfatitalea alkaliphila]MCJ8500165.1 hypothetical protein [Desulfatitalea alkaliphila]